MHHVVGGALIRGGRVLLGHRSASRRWYPDVWDFPGGHVEPGETEAQALAREMYEELGVRIGAHDTAPILRLQDPPDDPRGAARMTIWRIGEWDGEPVNRAPEEHDDLRWFGADELDALELADPSYLDVLRRALREVDAQPPRARPATHDALRPPSPHPLLPVLEDAAAGRFPPVDGGVTFFEPLVDGLECVVSFTGHAFIATRQGADAFADLGLDGFGAALDPAVLLRLAGPAGDVGVVDAMLVGSGVGGGTLPERHDLEDHHRVERARSLRRGVRVYGDERGLVTLARGLAGRTELSVEAAPDRQGRGAGRELIREALALAPSGEHVFAAVSPGNARSLRSFLAVGFVPIGSEVLIRPG